MTDVPRKGAKMFKNILTGAMMTAVLAVPAVADGLSASIDTWEIMTVVADDGTTSETRIMPDSIVPQDRVAVVANLSNTSEDALKSVSFVLNIDNALVIDMDGITPGEKMSYEFSTRQDPETKASFENLTVTNADGTKRAAEAADLGAIHVDMEQIDTAKNAVFEYTAIVR
jgi:hypothetical protein